LDSSKDKILAKAVATLSLLSALKENKDYFPDSDAICALVPLLNSPDETVKRSAIIALANLADHEKCRQLILDEEGFLPLLQAISMAGNDSVFVERLIWALSYFALEVDCHKDIREQGMGAIVALLTHERLPIVSLTLKTLLLLITKSEENKAVIRQLGVLPKLNALTGSTNRAVAAASQKVISLLG